MLCVQILSRRCRSLGPKRVRTWRNTSPELAAQLQTKADNVTGRQSRQGIFDALAATLVLADFSEARCVAGFAEQLRAVGAWAAEGDDAIVEAFVHEVESVLSAMDDGSMDTVAAATLIGEMITAMAESSEADTRASLPAEGNVYSQDPVVVAEFITGAREQLDEAEALLSSCMTGEEVDVAELFRCFHTLKGVAGFLSLDSMAVLAHDVETRLERIRSDNSCVDDSTVEAALAAVDKMRALVKDIDESRPEGAATERRTANRKRASSDTVRVDAGKLDYLLDALGELAVAESEIAAAVRRSGDEAAERSLERFQRIARDLQAATTSLRMVDLDPTFRKMTRVVRDMISRSGKPVDLIVSGGDTELDRQIVESISDPLVHLLRNSVDHGIEAPAQRKAAGKPERGHVELRAFHRTGNVHIEVSDDGRGIDVADLLAKATKMGIEADASTAMDLIFRPGFTTAERITETSGRGVGLDAVAAAVEGLRGQLEVRSDPGRGTTFTIRLPLTLAVIDGIVLRAGSERYVVPTQYVDRTMSVSDATLVSAAGRGDVLATEQEQLAVVSITTPFGGELEHGAVAVILDDGEQRFAVLVDEVIGQQSLVIKPLSGPTAKANGVAGASLMGDGKAALVIDPSGIVRALKGRW